jgi:hypothetical protein
MITIDQTSLTVYMPTGRASAQKPRRAGMTTDPASSQPHKTPCHNTRPDQRERREQQIGMYLITPL